MKSVCVIMAIFVFMLLSGCQTTTTDPRKGGLFGYNPKAYEKRLDDRRNLKVDLERQNTEIKQESEKLKEEYTSKQAEQDDLARKVASLDEEVDKIEKEIANITLRTDLQKHAKWKIDLKLKSLKNKLADTEIKERKLKALQKNLDSLLEEAASLSDL